MVCDLCGYRRWDVSLLLSPKKKLVNNVAVSLRACAIYYALWAHFIPNWKGYNLRQELITLEDGAQSNRLRKVPNEEVEEWDAVHVAGGAPY